MGWSFHGADISHYQYDYAPVDFVTLEANSQGYFATKATQRHNYIDPTMARSRTSAFSVGFRWVALYHWLSPTSEASVLSQIANWERAVGPLGIGECFMLDVEQQNVNGAITEPDAYEALDRVQQVIQRPGICYTGLSVAGGAIWRSERIRALGTAMHLAAYMTQERLALKLKAAGVQDLPMHLNQYSSDGPVPGVTGRCDMNQVNDAAILDRVSGYTTNNQGDDDMRLVQVTGDPAVILLAGLDATWIQGDSTGLVAALGPIVQVPRSTFKAFYLDGADPITSGVSPTSIADFKGRRPATGGGAAPTKFNIPSVPGVATAI